MHTAVRAVPKPLLSSHTYRTPHRTCIITTRCYHTTKRFLTSFLSASLTLWIQLTHCLDHFHGPVDESKLATTHTPNMSFMKRAALLSASTSHNLHFCQSCNFDTFIMLYKTFYIASDHEISQSRGICTCLRTPVSHQLSVHVQCVSHGTPPPPP